MKAAEHKSAAISTIQKKSNTPFFDTEHASEQESPFFAPQEASGTDAFFQPTTRPIIQTKLTVGQPNDKYEQEADTVADKVVQRLAKSDNTNHQSPITNHQSTHSISEASTPIIQHKTEAPEEEKLDRKEENKEELPELQKSPVSAVGDDEGLQMKCAECEAEEEHNEAAKETVLPDLLTMPISIISDSIVQMKCATCEGEEEKLDRKEESPEELPELQKMPVSAVGEEDNVQMKCAAFEAEQAETIQKKGKNTEGVASNNIEAQLQSSKGGGSSLPNDTRNSIESAMGAAFSNVRIHTDSNAVQMSQNLNAQAFTHGSDVYFNSGKYNPSSTEGSRLLAHELTHTVQQGSATIKEQPIQRKSDTPIIIQKTSSCEAEEEESGSEAEAAEAETAPDLGNCRITDDPAEQPPEGTEEPEEEATPASVDANAGAPVDERQSHAPPADPNAPEREEGIEEGATGEEAEQPQGPCALREAGATESGGAGSPTGEGSAAPSSAPTGEGAAGNTTQATDSGGGTGAPPQGAGANRGAAFLTTLTRGGGVQMTEQGENASPEVLSARDESTASSEEVLSSLDTTKNTINATASSDVQYLKMPAEGGNDEKQKKEQDNHKRSSAMASAFLSDRASQLMSFIDSSRASAELLRFGTVQKKVTLRTQIQQYKNQTSALYGQLRVSAQANAAATIQQIEARHLTTIANIEIKALLATAQVLEGYATQTEVLDLAYTTQLDTLDQVYDTAYTNLIDVGTRMGDQAVSRAREHENSYRIAENEPDAEKRNLVLTDEADGFWDGYLTVNRYNARADAAVEVGEQYQEGFVEEAQKQADHLICGKPQDIEMTIAIATAGLENLGCARDNSLDAIDNQRQGALMQAQYAKEELINTVQSSLTATLSQLRQQEAGQLQIINDYGIRQELAIDRDTERAIGSVIQGVNEAASKILGYLTQFRSTVETTQAPESKDLSTQLEGQKAQMATSFEAAGVAFDQSMMQATSSLDTGQEQALIALQQLYVQGEQSGYSLGTTFETTLAGLFNNATTTYDQLDANYDQVIQSEVESGNAMLQAIATAITGLYDRTKTGLEDRFRESAENTERGFQESLNNELDDKVCASAERAAADVKPWWKSVLKVLLIILVIVVVAFVIGPAIIGAVGAMAGALAGSLGAGAALAGTIGAWVGPIIGGAIVGALSGAVIQVGNNLIDMAGGEFSWERLGQGVWGAVIAGAIGGALGGLGGQFAQVIMGRVGTALSAGWRFAADFGIQAAFDVVGGVLGDLAAGNPITWESIVMGLAIGGAVQVSMHGLGGLARRSAGLRAGSPDVPTGGRFNDFANRVAGGRLGRGAEALTNMQSGMMAAGERFGARAGAFGDNAPTVGATRQALGDARVRIEHGEALPTRGGIEPEGWRGRGAGDSTTEPPTSRVADDEIESGASGRPHDAETPERVPRDVVEETPGTKFDADNHSGGDVTVTERGGIVRCFNPCELIEVKYRDIIDENPSIARDIELARQYAEVNEPLSRAKAQDALDALESLRALEVSQRLNGIVDDIDAQNGLVRLAQQDNEFFNRLVAAADANDLTSFGRHLYENPNLAAEIGNSPRLQRWITNNPTQLTRIQDLYNDYTRVRPTGEELASQDFAEYAGRRGLPIGSDIEPVQGVPRNNLPEPGSEAHQRWRDYVEGRSRIPCFPAGTIIKTPLGDCFIENIVAGDFVYAYDFQKGEPILAKVEQTFTNWAKVLVVISTENQQIQTTKNHHFWVKSQSEWLRADDLQEQMRLQFINDKSISIDNISQISQEVITFNFKVENYHNYYVGNQGCLVHNDDGISGSISGFADTTAYPSTIYVLRDPTTQRVIYVGQTIDEPSRFTNHLTNPDSAVYQYLLENDVTFRHIVENNPEALRSIRMEAFLDVRRPVELKNLTHYELSVIEQYHIDLHGGAKSQGGTLENRINAITPESIQEYRMLHNPCE